jgi:hypothetical protein
MQTSFCRDGSASSALYVISVDSDRVTREKMKVLINDVRRSGSSWFGKSASMGRF